MTGLKDAMGSKDPSLLLVIILVFLTPILFVIKVVFLTLNIIKILQHIYLSNL